METHLRAIRAEALLAEMAWVQRLARSLVRDPNLADDVAQDAWVQALERPPRHARNGPGLRAWLARVTRTLARQSKRSDSRRTAREHAAARCESQASTAEIVARGSMHRRLVEAVMALDEPYRSSILYRYLDGMSAPEIAERCGASPAAVRQRLSRGLAELRLSLDREFGGDRSAWSALLLPVSSVRIAGASIMAKTATSVVALQVLGVLAVCAGITFVISRSVRTDPVVSMSVAAPSSENAAPQPEGSHEASVQHEVRASATAEPEPTTSPPAIIATPAQDRPASQLDSLAETFLTDQPDVFGLMGAFRSMVRDATVLQETVKRNDDDGAMEGEIRVPGLAGKATFKITGKKYRLEFEPEKRPEPPFFMRNVSLWFRDDGGRADSSSMHVQYHPDTKAAFKALGEDEERFVGWSIGVNPEGVHADPFIMRRGPDGGSLIIGHTLKTAPRDEIGAPDLAMFDAWLRLLQPYAK